MICVGVALFTVVSIYGFSMEDQARVVAGIGMAAGTGTYISFGYSHSGAGGFADTPPY